MDGRPTGLILCGGNAERLGGIGKPLHPVAGKSLLARVIARLLPQVSQITISANRHLAEYQRSGFPVIDDGRFAGAGPLAGLLAGLGTRSGAVLCVPGDAPALPPDLAERLVAARGTSAIAYAHDGHGPQPLCCLLAGELHDDLQAYLDHGGRTPREWFARHAAVAVDFADVPRWAWSINTPLEWSEAEHHLAAAANLMPTHP